ncbi:MAG: hypothetical protein AAFO91_15495 [Bacteroidota bacterium]
MLGVIFKVVDQEYSPDQKINTNSYIDLSCYSHQTPVGVNRRLCQDSVYTPPFESSPFTCPDSKCAAAAFFKRSPGCCLSELSRRF